MSSTLERLILNLYEMDNNIVNNDTELTAKVYYLLGWDDQANLLENLKNMPRQDEITRTRRRLHQEGKIKYSKDVEEKRYNLYKEKTEEYGKALGNMFGIEIDEETNTVRLL